MVFLSHLQACHSSIESFLDANGWKSGDAASLRKRSESERTEVRFAAAARPRLAIDRDSILFKMCEMALPGVGRAADELMGGEERRG
jgi:hypothetical protein